MRRLPRPPGAEQESRGSLVCLLQNTVLPPGSREEAEYNLLTAGPKEALRWEVGEQKLLSHSALSQKMTLLLKPPSQHLPLEMWLLL